MSGEWTCLECVGGGGALAMLSYSDSCTLHIYTHVYITNLEKCTFPKHAHCVCLIRLAAHVNTTLLPSCNACFRHTNTHRTQNTIITTQICTHVVVITLLICYCSVLQAVRKTLRTRTLWPQLCGRLVKNWGLP